MDNIISAIIVTYNPSIEIFSRQIISLINEVDKIIFIDNGSKNYEDLINILNNHYDSYYNKFYIYRNNENLGIGKSQNIGIKLAQSLGSTDILILDHDSIIDIGFCKSLLCDRLKLSENNINVAAIGPIYYDENTNEIYPITKFYGPFIERIKIDNEPKNATFIIASGSLISLSVIDKVGLMNEDLFIDYVDVEWCFRAQDLGYGVYVSPSARMKHVIGDTRGSFFGRSISIHSPLRRYYLTRNSLFMLNSKYIPVGYKIRETFLNIFRILILLITQKNKLNYIRSFFWGFHDGFLKIYGKCTKDF